MTNPPKKPLCLAFGALRRTERPQAVVAQLDAGAEGVGGTGDPPRRALHVFPTVADASPLPAISAEKFPDETPTVDSLDAFMATLHEETDAGKMAETSEGESAGEEPVVERGPEEADDGEKGPPLVHVDHETIEYGPLAKNQYREPEALAALDAAAVAALRSALRVRVRSMTPGTAIPAPCSSFAELGLPEALLRAVARLGLEAPTAVQQQALPVALSGADVVAVAETGSGKTVAFALPLLVHVRQHVSQGAPTALVLAPTRELAHQIYSVIRQLASPLQLQVALAYGGGNRMEQFRALRAGANILVATPGRCLDLLRMRAFGLSGVSFLVLDEADRMLDLGFGDQVGALCAAVRPDRQTLLFSATLPPRAERLARAVLSGGPAVRIDVDRAADAPIVPAAVAQHAVLLRSGDDTARVAWLDERLAGFLAAGSVLVFVNNVQAVDETAALLKTAAGNAGVVALHSGLHQADRARALNRLRRGDARLLVATDLASRGLDLPVLRTVVSLHPARSLELHVHRVGRVGRAGSPGDAHVLFGPGDRATAARLAPVLGLSPDDPAAAFAASGVEAHRRGGGPARGRGFSRRRGRGGDSGSHARAPPSCG